MKVSGKLNSIRENFFFSVHRSKFSHFLLCKVTSKERKKVNNGCGLVLTLSSSKIINESTVQ